MKADTGTLMALCEKTDNDIRACINTLQVRDVCFKTCQNSNVGLLMLIGKKNGFAHVCVCSFYTGVDRST